MDADLRELIEARASAVREEPADAASWSDIGLTYEAHRLFEPARECYERAVELDPDDPRTRYHLALMQRETGHADAALETFAAVAERAPEYAPARWQRGFLLYDLGRLEEARGEFEAARAIDPDDEAAAAGLARFALASGDPVTAATILENLLRERRLQPYMHHLLGVAYRQLGHLEQARTALAIGRDSRPRWFDPWGDEALLQRVEFYTLVEEASAANDAARTGLSIPALEELRAKKPDDRRTLAALARAYLLAGRSAEGMETVRRMLAAHPDHFEVQLDAAAAHESLRNLPEALAHVDRSIEINPLYSASHRRRGIVLAKLGRMEEAQASLRRAVELAPDSVPAWSALGECRIRLGDWDGAAEALRHVVALAPERADSYSRLGMVLMRTGDREGANAAMARAMRMQGGEASP